MFWSNLKYRFRILNKSITPTNTSHRSGWHGHWKDHEILCKQVVNSTSIFRESKATSRMLILIQPFTWRGFAWNLIGGLFMNIRHCMNVMSMNDWWSMTVYPERPFTPIPKLAFPCSRVGGKDLMDQKHIEWLCMHQIIKRKCWICRWFRFKIGSVRKDKKQMPSLLQHMMVWKCRWDTSKDTPNETQECRLQGLAKGFGI